MTSASKFLDDTLKAELDVPIIPVREVQAANRRGIQIPAVIYRLDATNRDNILDGPGNPTVEYFEIECRARACDNAQNLGTQVLNALTGSRLTHILAQYDEPDDGSQQRQEYFSHILSVGISPC